MNKLYHYVHCPFCVRVRLALGYLNIDYESKVLPYHDENTPIRLTGKKMLPIFEFTDGSASNESLDIIKKLDTENLLQFDLLNDVETLNIGSVLSKLGGPIHNLCMPYWIYTKEFDEASRNYFVKKKSQKRGPFNELMKKKDDFLIELDPLLQDLEKKLSPYYKSKNLSILDIMIASHIWGMYIFPEFRFSKVIHNYLQDIKTKCKFEYHQDFWQ